MRFKPLLAIALLTAACALPGFPGIGSTRASQTETHSSSTTEEINGRPVRVAEAEPDEDADDERPRSRKRSKKSHGDLGKTCSKNNDCDTGCWLGGKQFGYCTKMCESFSDCPSHWECRRPNNAAQKVCVQDNW